MNFGLGEITRLLVALLALMILSSCGGGGGSGGSDQGNSSNQTATPTPTPTPTPSPVPSPTPDPAASVLDVIKADPSTLSVEELKSAYSDYADLSYTGNRAAAEISLESILHMGSKVFGRRVPYVPYWGGSIWNSTLSKNGSPQGENILYSADTIRNLFGSVAQTQSNVRGKTVNESFDCRVSGQVVVTGEVPESGLGNVSLDFQGCEESESGRRFHGRSALSIEQTNPTGGTTYFDRLDVQIGSAFIDEPVDYIVTGYDFHASDGLTAVNGIRKRLFQEVSAGAMFYEQSEYYIGLGISPSEFRFEGDIYDSEYGHMEFSSGDRVIGTSSEPSEGVIELIGRENATARFVFQLEIQPHQLFIDADGDGMFESGLYFQSFDELFGEDPATLVLIDATEMTEPPTPGLLRWSVTAPYTTLDNIAVYHSRNEDPDSEDSDLSFEFLWRINDVVVEGENEQVLPAGIARLGDVVSVEMIVTDRMHTVSSERISTTIVDSLPTADVSHLPSSIRGGEQLNAPIHALDADFPGEELPVSLAYGPEGMSINAEGHLMWTAQTQLFAGGSVFFGLNIPGDSEVRDFSITVDDDTALPFVRTKISGNWPESNVIVGNFGLEGKEEILTGNGSNFMLLAYEDGEYYQSWVYPYLLDSDAYLRHLLAYNLDEDDALEVIAVTNNSISFFRDRNSSPETLIDLSQYLSDHVSIHAATIADTNHDGIGELAIFYYDYNSDVSAYHLKVFSLSDPLELQFETLLPSASSRQFLFGNVDADPQLELVMSQGYVVDGVRWESEWEYSEGFGGRRMALGDLDGDNIDEIVAGSSVSFNVYSAQTQSVIALQETEDNQSILITDLENDGNNEIYVWGASLRKYSLSDGNLNLDDSVSTGNSLWGNTLTALNIDDDEDNELLWVKSGEDIEVLRYSSEGLQWEWVAPQIENLHSAGVVTSGGNEQIVFTADLRENSPYTIRHLMTASEEGPIIRNAELGRVGLSTYYPSEVLDYNNDGLFEILLSREDSAFDEKFSVMQLNDNAYVWDDDGRVIFLDSFDINADGYGDAIVSYRGALNFVDLHNQTLLPHPDSGGITDIAFTSGESQLVALVNSNSLQLWQRDGEQYQQSYISDEETYIGNRRCVRIAFANMDDDSAQELVCLPTYNSVAYTTTLYIYEIEDSALVQSREFTVPFGVIDFIVDSCSINQQGLLLAAFDGEHDSVAPRDSYIVSTSAAGQLLWKSPPLIGEINTDTMQYRCRVDSFSQLSFSTDEAIYKVR